MILLSWKLLHPLVRSMSICFEVCGLMSYGFLILISFVVGFASMCFGFSLAFGWLGAGPSSLPLMSLRTF